MTSFSDSNAPRPQGRPDGPRRVHIDLHRLFDKPPPHALEAEMALLGALILNPRVTPDVVSIIPSPEAFYLEAHAAIFRTLIDLYDRHQSGDLIQLTDALRSADALDSVGGIAYLEKLAAETPGSAGAPRWAEIVLQKHKLRSLITAAGEIIYDSYQYGQADADTAAEVIDKAEARIFEIAQQQEAADPQRLSDLLEAEHTRLLESRGKGVSGLATGFHDLDEMLFGLQPGEIVILAARPSMGKCLAADSTIVQPDGSLVTIETIARRRAGVVPTLRHDLKLDTAEPSDFVDDGIKPVFEVTTRLGRTVRTTLSHPFLTIDGWTPLAELTPGDHIAVPRTLPVFGNREMRECEVKLLAYLIGDGGLTGPNPRFTNSNPRIAEDFADAVHAFGGVRLSRSSTRPTEAPSWRVASDQAPRHNDKHHFAARLRDAVHTSGRTARAIAADAGVSPASITHWTTGATVPAPETFRRLCAVLRVLPDDLAPNGIERLRHNSPNALTAWLADLGLRGADSFAKHIPAPVFNLTRPLMALFLNRLFSTDGWATVLASGQTQIGYASVSRTLARHVQHLLLRFGIIASLRLRWVRYRDARRPCWQLDITDAKSITAFIREIGIFGKEDAVQRAADAVAGRKYQTNTDLIPRGVWRRVAAAKGDATWSEIERRMGVRVGSLKQGRRSPSRRRFAAIAEALNDNGLRALADSDIYWDRIVSIEPLGPQQVYDLTVPHTHNFVAEDVCVHNTALALNLAEQIALGGRAPHERDTGVRVPVGFFSMEMSKSSVTQRLISACSGVDAGKLRSGSLTDNECIKIERACETLSDAPIYVDDTPGLTVLALRARARRMVAQHGVRAVFVDYLQLMTAPNAARESRQVEVSAISRGVKALARELNVPVICLSQLNRGPESRESNRPRMSDLRESGSIEQDADVVLLLHREEYYHVNDPNWKNNPENEDKIGLAEIIVAKQRNGPTGGVRLTWDNSTVRFKNHARPQRGYAHDDFSHAPPPSAAAYDEYSAFGASGFAAAPPAAPRGGGGVQSPPWRSGASGGAGAGSAPASSPRESPDPPPWDEEDDSGLPV